MGRYDDIIGLPHHQSERRAHMPIRDRAAQFAPFAALTGFGAAIDETARRTDTRITLSDDRKAELNEQLRQLAEQIAGRPYVILTYFIEDARKSGGAYVTKTGTAEKIDLYTKTIFMTDGTTVPLEDLLEMEMPEDGI